MNKYYPKYQEKLIAQEKMTYKEILEDTRLNPLPMVLETNPADFYDEHGVLVKNYVLEKGGKKAAVVVPVVEGE
jgi:hypothetical protein